MIIYFLEEKCTKLEVTNCTPDKMNFYIKNPYFQPAVLQALSSYCCRARRGRSAPVHGYHFFATS